MYTGGTTLLTEAYTPRDKAKTQGLNDFIVFAVMGVSSLSSGALIDAAGWERMNAVALRRTSSQATGWRRRAAESDVARPLAEERR